MLRLDRTVAVSTVVLFGMMLVVATVTTTLSLDIGPDIDVELVLAQQHDHVLLDIVMLPTVPKGWDSVIA